MDKRAIKFRAWDEGNNIMHNEVQFIKTGDDGNDWIVFSSKEHRYKTEGNSKIVFGNPYFSQQIKLMQYTGLKDKNGKEIYEGDIVNNVKVKYYTKEVKWRVAGNHVGWNIGLGQYGENNLEVIGNIYEHPELLKTVIV